MMITFTQHNTKITIDNISKIAEKELISESSSASRYPSVSIGEYWIEGEPEDECINYTQYDLYNKSGFMMGRIIAKSGVYKMNDNGKTI